MIPADIRETLCLIVALMRHAEAQASADRIAQAFDLEEETLPCAT